MQLVQKISFLHKINNCPTNQGSLVSRMSNSEPESPGPIPEENQTPAMHTNGGWCMLNIIRGHNVFQVHKQYLWR